MRSGSLHWRALVRNVDAQELPGANQNAGISDAVIARRGEEPAAGDDDVALLSRQRGGKEREQQCDDA